MNWRQARRQLQTGALILLTVLSWPVGWLMVTVQYQSAVALQSPVQTECVACYVDYAAGDDRNPGTAPSTPWKTLAKINATVFHPGNRILFKSGSVWTGQLWPKGSGSTEHPIVIDNYYGQVTAK